MPIPSDPTTPAALRYSRTPKKKIAVTAVITTGLSTVASGALDAYQNGDYCTITDAVVGTKLTGQPQLAPDTVYKIEKVSATTLYLRSVDAGTRMIPTVAITAGAALQFGSLGAEILAPNIVASGSVAGGAYGTPLD